MSPAAALIPPPQVSVIVPTFNYGKFIAETIGSLQAQSLQEWECIVVDDGSTDDTRCIVSTIARIDSRVRYFHQANRGQPVARNYGITEARGEFVQMLDSDDLLESQKLEVHCGFLRAHPEVDLVYGGCRYFSTDRPRELRYSMMGPDHEWMPCASGKGAEMIELLLDRNIMAIHCPLVRRAVLHEVGLFDESLTRADDWDLWLRCAVAGMRFHFLDAPETLALTRIHTGSLTQRNRSMLRSLIAIHRKIESAGLQPNLDAKNCSIRAWLQEVESLAQTIDAYVPHRSPFILIDDEKYRGDLLGYEAIPFKNVSGNFAGPPTDDQDAIDDTIRAHSVGCRYLVIARSSQWYYDHFPMWKAFLLRNSRCLTPMGAGNAAVFEFEKAIQP